MMGQPSRTESLFYYFRLEEQIPTDHLLRIIDSHVDSSFVREELKDFYSATGRSSIDPDSIATAAGRLSLRHHQRTAFNGRGAHASGLSLVHASRF